MSGIAGIIYKNKLEDGSDIKRMTDAISHRGPDGEGFIAISTFTGKVTELDGEKLPLVSNFGANANVYLGQRNLAVKNLSKKTHQPIANQRKDIWLIFDGEIYNHNSLKNELSEFQFASNTDTEVLLYAYEKWGINF